MRQKRIVFVEGGFSSGGAEHQCAQLMNMLVEKGYEVECVTFVDIEDHYEISSSVKRVRVAEKKPLWKKILALEWYLLTVKTEVVVAFSQRLSVLSLPPYLFRPYVKLISSDRNLTIGKPSKFEKILLKTKLWYRADHIVPNSYSQGKYLASKSEKLGKRITVITNYTDVDLFKYIPMKHREVIKIGVLCRYEHQKNFHGFIEMLHVLRTKTDRKFHVDWYGNHDFNSIGQKQYYETCVNKIKEYELEDVLTVNGAIKNVSTVIPQYDMMCLPSLKEGFSNSISEYICCGRPVLCSDVSDNSVMVHDGENGFLFDPNSLDSMCSAFLKFFELNNVEIESMGRKSRKIAESLFDKEQFINKYIKLIEA